MCGRYAASRNPDELVEQFEIEEDELRGDDSPAPSFNVAPTQQRPVVLTRAPRPVDGQAAGEPVRRLRALRWGLVPPWAKDVSIGNRFINSRSEKLLETPAFRKAAVARRCLVPADGWYEWQQSPTEKDAKGRPRKQPFFMTRADEDVTAFAGIYELWFDGDRADQHDDDPSRWLFSFSIVTTEAEPGLDVIHDRMPVVLERSGWGPWLDPAMTDPDGVRALLAAHEPGRFTALPVSTRVNNVRNDGPELREPAAREELAGVLDPATGELIGASGEKLF